MFLQCSGRHKTGHCKTYDWVKQKKRGRLCLLRFNMAVSAYSYLT